MHSHQLDIIKPLGLSIVAAAAGSVHELLGVTSLSLSIIYTLYKFYKEEKNK
jgi:hypothetical protein